jgi:hypothetical protein
MTERVYELYTTHIALWCNRSLFEKIAPLSRGNYVSGGP